VTYGYNLLKLPAVFQSSFKVLKNLHIKGHLVFSVTAKVNCTV
jgi:hypothetical protein